MIAELFKDKYERYGKEISGYKMENGEYRFRLSSDQSAYIRTESTKAVWQNSHFHSEQTEYFLVEKGEVLFATMENGDIEIRVYSTGDFFFVSPMIPHNMCLSEGGITHTIKFGGMPDWNAFPRLDEYLKRRKK